MGGIVRFRSVAGSRLAGWRSVDRRLGLLIVLVLVVALLASGLVVRLSGQRDGDLVVGAVGDARTREPAPFVELPLAAPDPLASITVEDGPGIRPGGERAGRPTGQRLLDPTGRPYGAPIPFNADIPVPEELVWVLLVGEDRPGHHHRLPP
jgi:hypothetical protein